MSTDPFEQFERSRAGLLIPVALFLMGAMLTFLAIRALDPYVLSTQEQEALIADQERDVTSLIDPEIQSGLKESGIDLEEVARQVRKEALTSDKTDRQPRKVSDP